MTSNSSCKGQVESNTELYVLLEERNKKVKTIKGGLFLDPGRIFGIPGSQNSVRIPGYQDPRIPGAQDPRVLGAQDPRIPGAQDPRIPGSQDPRILGSQEPRIPGAQDPRIPGSQEPRMRSRG